MVSVSCAVPDVMAGVALGLCCGSASTASVRICKAVRLWDSMVSFQSLNPSCSAYLHNRDVNHCDSQMSGSMHRHMVTHQTSPMPLA